MWDSGGREGLRVTTKLLWMAIVGGHEAVVKLLVDQDDVEADSKGSIPYVTPEYSNSPL